MIAFPLALCLLCPPQDPAAKPAEPRALTIVSLQPFVTPQQLVTPRARGLSLPFGSLLSSRRETFALIPAAEGDAQFQPDELGEFVRALHTEDESAQIELRYGGSTALLLAPPELGKRVDGELRELLATIGRPIELEVAVLAWDGPLPPTVLGADELARTLTNHAPLARGVIATRSSVAAAVEQLRWTSFVSTAECEVAQEATATRPVVDQFAEGLGAVVAPHALEGSDDIVLFAQFALSQRRELTTLATGFADRPSLDFPRLATAYGAVAARVPNGGAMIVPLGGHAQAGLQHLLVVTARAPQRAAASLPIAIVPISALTTTALSQDLRVPAATQLPVPEEDLGARTTDGERSAIDADALRELMLAATGDEQTSIQVTGGFAFVRGTEAARRAASEVVRTLQDRWLVNIALHCTAELRETDGAGGLAGPLANGATTALHDVALPCLPGRTSMLFRGIEATGIAQQMIEIAQKATAQSPVVKAFASGLWLRAEPALVQGGIAPRLLAHLGHASPSQQRRIEPQGLLMLGDVGEARFEREATMTNGQDVALGDGPVLALDGKNWRPSLRVRVQTR